MLNTHSHLQNKSVFAINFRLLCHILALLRLAIFKLGGPDPHVSCKVVSGGRQVVVENNMT